MCLFTIEEIQKITKGVVIQSPKPHLEVKAICIDTRILKPGDAFIAIKGENHDGHDFIEKACEKNAPAIIVEKEVRLPKSIDATIIKVESTFMALEQLAKAHREKFSLLSVAITGSVGKTTTKELASQIVSAHYETLKTPKSFNNNIGIPLTLLELKEKHQAMIMEMGANHFGEIDQLSKLVHPKISLITCVRRSHLEGFGNLKGVEKAKGEIVHGMDKTGVLIVNGDDPACMRIAKKFTGKVVTFGLENTHDIQAKSVISDKNSLRFCVLGQQFQAPIPGKHNIYNVLASISIAKELGISLEDIQKEVERLTLPPMRMQITSKGSITIINDAYNANPESIISAINFLKEFPSQRRIAILGGMLELGKKSDELHFSVGSQIDPRGIEKLFLIGKETNSLKEGALSVGVKEENIIYFETTDVAKEKIPALCKLGDVILLKASRKYQLELLEPEIFQAL